MIQAIVGVDARLAELLVLGLRDPQLLKGALCKRSWKIIKKDCFLPSFKIIHAKCTHQRGENGAADPGAVLPLRRRIIRHHLELVVLQKEETEGN